MGRRKMLSECTEVRYDGRARRVERVGRSFIGIGVRMQLRRSRTYSPDARERYRGHLRNLASQPTLYRDHQPPDLGKYPHFRSQTLAPRSESSPSDLDRQIGRSDGQDQPQLPTSFSLLPPAASMPMGKSPRRRPSPANSGRRSSHRRRPPPLFFSSSPSSSP